MLTLPQARFLLMSATLAPLDARSGDDRRLWLSYPTGLAETLEKLAAEGQARV